LVRDGETLKRIGKMAELFDDHSPLQLQTSGTWRGQSFTLLGRLQYKYGEGTWTEWHAVLADGSSAYLSEDNGAYVWATTQTQSRDLPGAEHFRVGATTAISGHSFSVASNQQVMLLAAQGELPHLPALGQPFAMVELRSQDGIGTSVLSLDYSTQPPTVMLGQPVLLDDLKLTGLRDGSAKMTQGRQFNCPNCGSGVTVALESSQSISCPSCSSLIDLSSGIGGELKHAIQDEPVRPLIALGSVGQLQGVAWQVVGFQHRMGVDPSDPDEHFGWDEYLLYNQKRGFIFLVDSTDGWSVVKPATGAPVMTGNASSATYLGTRYQLKESYNAETTYALGEFYWRVSRGQKTSNRDFASGAHLLSLEQSANEVTWSVGSRLDSAAVAKAFKLEDKKALLTRSDVGPFSASLATSTRALFIYFMIFVVFVMVVNSCSQCDPQTENCSSSYSSGSRSSGGSFGGFSSGGGHK
jgi:ribosomal protein S27E